MTVAELHKELSLLIEQGHGDTRVIANCEFTIRGNYDEEEYYSDFYLTHLNGVYYQSGDIELGFSQEEE